MVSRRIYSITLQRSRWAWVACSSLYPPPPVEDGDICFLPFPQEPPPVAVTSRDDRGWPHSDTTRLPKHRRVHPTRSHGLLYVYLVYLSIPHCGLFPWEEVFPPPVSGTWTHTLAVKAEVRRASRALLLHRQVQFAVAWLRPWSVRLGERVPMGTSPKRQARGPLRFPRQAFPARGSGSQPAIQSQGKFSLGENKDSSTRFFSFVFNCFRLCIWSIFEKILHFAGVALWAFFHHRFFLLFVAIGELKMLLAGELAQVPRSNSHWDHFILFT